MFRIIFILLDYHDRVMITYIQFSWWIILVNWGFELERYHAPCYAMITEERLIRSMLEEASQAAKVD